MCHRDNDLMPSSLNWNIELEKTKQEENPTAGGGGGGAFWR
jgi:hypothetical protein